MADHIVLGHPRRPYIKIEKVQLVEKQTGREQRKNRHVNYRGHSISRWIVHYCSTLLISMVMKYCIESIAKYSKVQYNILHLTIPKYNTIYCTLL